MSACRYVWLDVNLIWRSDQMSIWPKVVWHLATRCLCLGVCLTKCQPDPKIWPNINLTQSSITLGHKISLPLDMSDQMSSWPKEISHLATRCLPGGMSDQMSTWPKVVSYLATRCLCLGICLTRCQPDPKIWPNVNLTQGSITLGHKMPLPGDMSDQMSTWPKDLTKCQPDPK